MKTLNIILFLNLVTTCAYATVVKPSQLPQEFQIQISYDGSNQVEYVGKSLEPCGSGEACWQIKKLTYSGSNITDVQWANGTHSYDFIWSSRTGYTYS